MNNNIIKLFPSNWLYNAGVIGFLKVMAFGLGNNLIEIWLNDDGTVDIDRSVFRDALKFYFEYHTNKYDKGKPPIYGNSYYKNFINPSAREKDERKLGLLVGSFVNDLENDSSKYQTCSICGLSLGIKNISNDLNEFLEMRDIFNTENGPFGPSFTFPNSFWNLESSLHLCPLCVYLIIHHHLAFEPTKEGEMFINAPSFKLMWHLNKSTEVLFSTDNLKEILGIRLIKLSQKINKTLGVWSLMNIEMIVKSKKEKNKEEINYYFLPSNISALLLNNNIASLITKANERLILNMVLEEKFDELLELNYRLIRYISTTNKEKLNKTDSYIKDIYNKNSDHVLELIKILPELYVKIKEKE
ncbi:hypothetical protein [Thermoanaerobacterium thermosaccharolyticum]|uniref:hypothetical protein n=1 Tax=Thermoanaerobacterium thermosaccharolyticum TaxID=1517 RepID=UPI00177E1ED5|nr:hypothetical protein [Thermoanaerobacterium thermosaccharolyticum]MBE0069226.1 hypothetical protein [Thermoanaerobacterium thermosaccharolyticum]MBE0228102.1 hypothetical protein [Thermoanaerobacterium thermosaccharolyticum]